MDITPHRTRDWCHLCGQRQYDLVDIWYPENAEHGGRNSEYIRICMDCGGRIFCVAVRESRSAGLNAGEH